MQHLAPKCLGALAALLVLVTTAAGADDARHIDLGRYFFHDSAAEMADRAALTAALKRFDGYRGHLASSAATLLAALRLNDRIQIAYNRHELYLFLRCKLNRMDLASCDGDNAVSAEVASGTAFFGPELAHVAPRVLDRFLRQEAGLRPYRYEINSRGALGRRSRDASKIAALAEFTPEIAGWQSDLYDEIIDQAPYGMVETLHGTLDANTQANLLAADPDPAVRKAGFEKRRNGLLAVRDLAAFALLRTVRAGDKLAQALGYANAPDRKYIELGLDPGRVRALIAKVSAQGGLIKRFERIRIADIKAHYGIDPGRWDMGLPVDAPPNIPLASVPGILHDAFAPLGPWYQDAFDALLAPQNGRADIVQGGSKDRAGGGFSVGFPGTTGMLFVGNFAGTYKSISVIAHEGGHAVHREFMNRSGVRPAYASGPNFLFESFAVFNELVLADSLGRAAQTPQLARFYQEQFLAVKGLDFLAGAQDAALEQAIYDGAEAHTVSGADQIEALTLKVDGQFSLWPAKTPLLRTRWMDMPLAFEDPLYDVNYMYAGMLALKYFELYKIDPKTFLPRYQALLRNGFDAPPKDLLARFLDIDLDGDALLDSAVTVIDGRLKKLGEPP